jgi:maltokinase
MGVEQSNTSLVYDDRVVLKLFRRVRPGANPDVEVTNALAKAGFAHVAAPLGVWRRDGHDLAVAQPFLAGAADGWALALTSLRDLYATECEDPGDCGGDFAGEATRLGDVTARMHLALAGAFATSPGDGNTWAGMADTQLERLERNDADSEAARRFVTRLRTETDVGMAIRVHGDYHLGQVLQAEGTWYVLDFEGEPVRSMDERAALSSPLKDVAGMLRSFQYAAAVALSEQDLTRQDDLAPLAARWEARNRRAFLDGYLAQAAGSGLLPTSHAALQTVLRAFELDKAVYEVLYERGHRPDWVSIPQAAIRRLLSET